MCSDTIFKLYLLEVLFLVGLVTTFYQETAADFTIPEDNAEVKDLNERLKKRVSDLGFGLETLDVVTEDEYVLKVHRLKNKDGVQLKSPVLIMHGIRGCSPVFLAIEKSIAYGLAKAGHDVWVANARGTAFSMKHKHLTPSQRKYWDFSFHEVGHFDIPAFLDKIKEVTRVQKVHFVGMSMGTASFLVMASTRNTVTEASVASITLMAPIAIPTKHKSIRTKRKRIIIKFILKAIRLIGRGDVYRYSKSISMFKYKICRDKGWVGHRCEIFFKQTHAEIDLFDHVGALEVLPFFPCGTSIKSYLHFIQLAEAEQFQQFDYGRKINKKVYGREKPLQYDLGNVNKEINLLVGGQDAKAHLHDIQWLQTQLKHFNRIDEPFKYFDHRDFEYSTELDVVSKTILGIIKEYENPNKLTSGRGQ